MNHYSVYCFTSEFSTFLLAFVHNLLQIETNAVKIRQDFLFSGLGEFETVLFNSHVIFCSVVR